MARNFWAELEALLAEHPITIDRPCGQPHLRHPELVYPLDYGYLEGTTSGDGAGIDVWIGTKADRSLTGILCTIDIVKRDAEIKLLVGCTPADVEMIMEFNDLMGCLFIPKPRSHS